jgi:hypothetical protein
MNFHIKRKILILAIYQVIIFLFAFIFYHKVSLLNYINISFYISGALLLTSFLVYTIHSGFFDVIFKSLNLAFSKGDAKRKWDEIPSLSRLITINNRPLLFYGLSNALFMLVALFFYYFDLT